MKNSLLTERSFKAFGTGSEDYVGYAWSPAQPFTPITGHAVVNRFHIAGELDHHLSEGKRVEQPKRRNGKSKKTV